MNPQLKQLYKQTLLAHSKSPHNNHALPEATATATIRNPLCGDEITVYAKTNDAQVTQLSFTAQACSICTASASMLTQTLASQPITEAVKKAEVFVSNFKNSPTTLELEGDLAALSGVAEFPSRIRCATLPWEAFLEITDS